MKQFKAESKKILDLMINSIYTNKEVFLRELISNASDAIDKLYYQSLSQSLGLNFDSFFILVDYNEKEKSITIKDNGIGMNKTELDTFLGVIAKSDSESFKQLLNEKDDVKIIGRFGVGFYSTFMVASTVKVLSKKYNEDKAYLWTSNGIEGYSIKEATKESYGTEVTLYLKEDTKDEKFSKYVQEYTLTTLIKKYSNYVRYPIKLKTQKNELDADGKETKSTYETFETINSMTPIWTKKKKDLKADELNQYYKDEFNDFEDPLASSFISLEGNISYQSVIFIPKKPAHDYYYKSFEKGLKLYSNNVLIMEKCKELLPDHYSFVRGVLSCELDLNISREIIQKSAELAKIAKSLEKKIKAELEKLLKDQRNDYETFFEGFGARIKYSIWESYGGLTTELQDLLIFKSLKEDKYVTLAEYVTNCKNEERKIYFAKGKSTNTAKSIPQADYLLKKDIDILLFSDDVDEFLTKVMNKYKDYEFKSITSSYLESEEKPSPEEEMVLNYMKEKLSLEVEKVRFSKAIGDFPVTFSSSGDLSVEMEQVLSMGPNPEKVQAKKVLEINSSHKIHNIIMDAYNNDKTKLDEITLVLYSLARLNAGLVVDDIPKLIKDIAKLIG